jgi:hypothetical protein
VTSTTAFPDPTTICHYGEQQILKPAAGTNITKQYPTGKVPFQYCSAQYFQTQSENITVRTLVPISLLSANVSCSGIPRARVEHEPGQGRRRHRPEGRLGYARVRPDTHDPEGCEAGRGQPAVRARVLRRQQRRAHYDDARRAGEVLSDSDVDSDVDMCSDPD